MSRLVKAYEPSRDFWEESDVKIVSREEEISSEVGGTPEGPFATTVGIAGVSEEETMCGIFQRIRESLIECRYQREISEKNDREMKPLGREGQFDLTEDKETVHSASRAHKQNE